MATEVPRGISPNVYQRAEEMTKIDVDEYTDMEEIEQAVEAMSYFVSLLVKTVAPQIYAPATYEIIHEMLTQMESDGITDEEVLAYAKRVKNTEHTPQEDRKTH